MWAYSFAPTGEPKLSNPTEVQDAIQGLKVGKAPGPNGIPNRALKHHPLSVVFLPVVLFNTISWTQYLAAAWKHALMFSILKQGKDPALSSSYWPISLLTRNLFEIGRRALLCNEQFGFRVKHSTALQLTLLIERVSRNFGKKRLTGAVFLVAKTFHIVWDNSLNCKLTVLNFSLGTLSKPYLPTAVGVPFFTDHISSLTERLNSKVSDLWNPLVT
jgi:hypothetical protein